jgi:hypothetical protein
MRVYGMVKGYHGDDEHGTLIFPSESPEKLREKRKRCPGCGLLLPLSDFKPDARTKDGRAKVCRTCAKDPWRR